MKNATSISGVRENSLRQTRMFHHQSRRSPSLCTMVQRTWKRRQVESAPELPLWLLIMQTGSALQSIPSASLFCPVRRDLQTKVCAGLSVGPTWAGANLRYLQRPLWLPTDSVVRSGNTPSQAFQCGLETQPHLDKIQERRHQNTWLLLFCLQAGVRDGVNTSFTLIEIQEFLQILCAQINLKFSAMLGLNETGMHKVLPHHKLLICSSVSYKTERIIWTSIMVFRSCLLTQVPASPSLGTGCSLTGHCFLSPDPSWTGTTCCNLRTPWLLPLLLKPCPHIIALHTTRCAHLSRTMHPTTG